VTWVLEERAKVRTTGTGGCANTMGWKRGTSPQTTPVKRGDTIPSWGRANAALADRVGCKKDRMGGESKRKNSGDKSKTKTKEERSKTL